MVPVTVDGDGKLNYDGIVKQGNLATQLVKSRHADLLPKDQSEMDLARPDETMADETTKRTQAAMDALVAGQAQKGGAQVKQAGESQFIKYTPAAALDGSAQARGAPTQRVIRMVEKAPDPLEPSKFRMVKAPRGAGSPPVPVMHSPPRKVSVQDQADWKIPQCVSNWKNTQGYTIPLDKRLAADGRGLQEVAINDNFAKLSEALYVAEQKARESVEYRAKISKELALREKEKKEADLRELAQRARLERTGGVLAGRQVDAMAAGGAIPGPPPGAPPPGGLGMVPPPPPPSGPGGASAAPAESAADAEARRTRDEIRGERRRDRERERRLEARGDEKDGRPGKRSRLDREADRDISEAIALGQARVGGGGGEVMYDQRLFNQDIGAAAGVGNDEAYNLYDKALFEGHEARTGLYRPKRGGEDDDADGDATGAGAQDPLSTARFRADKGFAGAEGGAGGAGAPTRTGPVQFEREAPEADPFGLDQFLSEVKGGSGRALDKIGQGQLHAGSAGGGGGGDGSGRDRVDFQRGGR